MALPQPLPLYLRVWRMKFQRLATESQKIAEQMFENYKIGLNILGKTLQHCDTGTKPAVPHPSSTVPLFQNQFTTQHKICSTSYGSGGSSYRHGTPPVQKTKHPLRIRFLMPKNIFSLKSLPTRFNMILKYQPRIFFLTNNSIYLTIEQLNILNVKSRR